MDKIILILLLLITISYGDEKKKPIRTIETIELIDLAHDSYKVRKIAPDLLLQKALKMDYVEMTKFFAKCLKTYKSTKDIEYQFNLKTIITELYFPIHKPYARKFIIAFYSGNLKEIDFKFIDFRQEQQIPLRPQNQHNRSHQEIIEKETFEKLKKDFKDFCKLHKINIKEK